MTDPPKRLSEPPRLDEFPHRVVQDIRFGDLDRQNHVNNAVFSTFFESGRVPLLYDPAHGLVVEGTTFVLARAEIDFRGEMHWPGEVEIGTAVARVGGSSLTFRQALFVGGRCVAEAYTTVVCVDKASRKPFRFPDAMAEAMKRAAPRTPGAGGN